MRQGIPVIHAVGLVVSVLFSPTVSAATSPVGATDGKFNVDHHGRATYDIPVIAPPGTGGMVPKIQLSYTKKVESELMGVGFSIGGLSIVNRCGKTIALDGKKGGVKYDVNDRFCLDGQRLILVSGIYGTNGAEYRTERESFSRIFSYGQQGSGPQYFRVTTKDGTVMEYGVTADSRIEAQGKTSTRVWALNKVQDVNGNYYTVRYMEDSANGQYAPSRIDYTGNGAAGLAPYNSIRFTYDTVRPDLIPEYQAGSKILTTTRLIKVESYSDSNVVRTFKITYGNAGTANRSRPTSMQECGADNVCFPATTLAWSQEAKSFGSEAVWGARTSTTNIEYGTYRFTDVNGDGTLDAFYLGSDRKLYVSLNSGTAFGAEGVWGIRTSTTLIEAGTFQFVDVNNDGRPDAFYLGSNGNFYVLLNTGKGFSAEAIWGSRVAVTSLVSGSMQFVDLNGDGLPDIFYLGSDKNFYVLLNTGKNFGPEAVWGSRKSNIAGTFLLTDVNGDDLPDVFYNATDNGSKNFNVLLNSGSGFGPDTVWVTSTISTLIVIGSLQFADVNRDGLPDISYLGTDKKFYVLLNTGTGFSTDAVWGTRTSTTNLETYNWVDLNGDTLPDMCYLGTDRNLYVLINNGTALSPETVWGTRTSITNLEPGTFQFVDVTGDELPDSSYLGTDKKFYVLRNSGTSFSAEMVWGTRTSTTNLEPGTFQFVDVNGDGLPDGFYLGTDWKYYTLLDITSETNTKEANALTSIVDGLGASITIFYKAMADASVYVGELGARYPYVDVYRGSYVVSRILRSDGVGTQYGLSYRYGGAKAYVTGQGWLGFSRVMATDERSNVLTTTYLNQTYDGASGTVNRIETRWNGATLKRQSQFWSAVDIEGDGKLAKGRKFAALGGTLEETFELNDTSGITATCTQVDNTFNPFTVAGNYGDYGLPRIVVSKTDKTCSFISPFVKTTVNTYDHANGVLGKLARMQVKFEAPAQDAMIRTSSFAYDTKARLIQEIVEPDEPATSVLRLESGHTYDNVANRISTTVTGAQPDGTSLSRTNTVSYDTRGQFVVSTTNALGQSPPSPATYDARWGVPLTVTDINGLTTSVEYDGFGRKVLETRPDGAQTTVTYSWCNTTTPCSKTGSGVAPKYRITTQVTGFAATKAYHDLLGRAVRNESVSLGGKTVYQDTAYDNYSRVTKSSHPYFAADPVLWDATSYDVLDRISSTTDADGRVTTTSYQGLKMTVTGSVANWVVPQIATRSRIMVKNAMGQNVSVTDSLYPTKPTEYQYNAVGDITRVTDPLGNATTMIYDIRGRKIQMSDPDMGAWVYTYNSLGEQKSQTDALGQSQTIAYDLLGRMTSRSTRDGISTWTYDTAPLGGAGVARGLLASVSGPNGYQESYTYDSLARPSTHTILVDGVPYATGTTYDNVSRISTVTYPQTGFVVQNVYNNNGYLAEVRNHQNSFLYWQAQSSDAAGRLTSEIHGNALTTLRTYDSAKDTLSALRTTGAAGNVQDLEYSFDVRGNLLSRTDQIRNLAEQFEYDTLNRLTAVSGPAPKTFTYDEIGNITSKSDVGTYSYGAKPHAVVATSGVQNNSYTYDANGSMLTGAGRVLTYTGFNKPSSITANGQDTILYYDAHFNRVKKFTADGTTVYVGKHYEAFTTASLLEHRQYIMAGAAVVAIYTQRSTGVNDTRYLHFDHLGSTDTITDEAGQVISGGPQSFDAWGKRRSPDWTDASTPIEITTPTTHGFTGHEMDDEVGLINMNARLYDPNLGRFITADTIVETSFGQGLNRYTYVRNSPLSLTDPTGFNSEGGGGEGGGWFEYAAIWATDLFSEAYQSVANAVSFGSDTAPQTEGAFVRNDPTVNVGPAAPVPEKISTAQADLGCRFFCMTTFVSARRNVTLDESVAAGKLFREFTGPALATAEYAQFIGGAAAAVPEVVATVGVRVAVQAPRATALVTELSAAEVGLGVGAAGATAKVANRGAEAVESGVESGTRVFRIWGDEAGAWGRSWTTVDPRAVPGYRDAAGLPNQNTGRFLSEGTLRNAEGVAMRKALSLDGNAGGLPELVIPNPQRQIRLDNVQGLNPRF